MTLKRTLVTNDDGITRETLVDDERVQPEDERPLPQLPPLGLLPHSNWSKHRLSEWSRANRQPGIDRSGWVGIGWALVIVAVLVFWGLLIVRLSGCAPPDEFRTATRPDIGIPDKPKLLAIAWAGTLDVATPYPARSQERASGR